MLWRGLHHWPSGLSSRWEVSALISLSGLLVEPLAWMQSLLFTQRLQRVQLPDDPIVVIGHWRSGTTYLHQLMACDPCVATASQHLDGGPPGGVAAQALDRSIAEGLDDPGPADRCGSLGPG